jgi:hypothetical protein
MFKKIGLLAILVMVILLAVPAIAGAFPTQVMWDEEVPISILFSGDYYTGSAVEAEWPSETAVLAEKDLWLNSDAFDFASLYSGGYIHLVAEKLYRTYDDSPVVGLLYGDDIYIFAHDDYDTASTFNNKDYMAGEYSVTYSVKDAMCRDAYADMLAKHYINDIFLTYQMDYLDVWSNHFFAEDFEDGSFTEHYNLLIQQLGFVFASPCARSANSDNVGELVDSTNYRPTSEEPRFARFAFKLFDDDYYYDYPSDLYDMKKGDLDDDGTYEGGESGDDFSMMGYYFTNLGTMPCSTVAQFDYWWLCDINRDGWFNILDLMKVNSKNGVSSVW